MTLLSVEGLTVELPGSARPVLDAVDLSVAAGEVVGLVGESGSGKSVTARSALGLLPAKARVTGRVLVEGKDLVGADAAHLREVRTGVASMVFQDPRAGINPVRRIGDFLTEPLRLTKGWSKRQAEARALELLAAVGLPDPPRHLRQYPHQLSGGMLQRVMIAGALAGEPRLLLCDEPTTALDVSTQAEILALLGGLQRERGLGLLLITHDIELAAASCDRVYVMYAGRIVEEASAGELFGSPRHPYTRGLLGSTPPLTGPLERLRPVPGAPMSLAESAPGCAFAARCDFAEPGRCDQSPPRLLPVPGAADRSAACVRVAELPPVVATEVRS
ncbi:ABC transporter ATP-binding protein [Streptacidiphilus jiangxiensis]|uniref:Oligopeptide/dipeptide ABC transporter, ATP-binding protein, C-terminal domain-containing protein n=1 Tax=Streptacidiphilus jiangxiensis TaxID=235985 RepID=A0A1H7WZ75_STRJI|nr:ABC transporter ATP-binding protein [Streptacidiphilus jiangxiensis]SEM26691.1 oligopeptide/dipeptide ABC transporter, ATP-binding protein, C-terminal domain-containing protein [Streptacidiphilus jiangxiensis]